MGRVLAIDYGKKRTGLAVTDPLKIIATALETVLTIDLLKYLADYMQKEEVEQIVLGLPVNLNSQDTDITADVRKFADILRNQFPAIPLHFYDERFTSKMALQSMIDSGTKKKDRREKGNLDKISAVIILQSFLSSNKFF
ncbi:COG0816 Predicted endonuclease involved in recombination (possible Holliday junction resolvase in Mycoplasmas and B. subtilis) [Spirosomataceae bacterium]|jgi:putative Holliday junction resolvase